MKILLTILGCIVGAAAGGLAFIYSGLYDVSATTPDNVLVAWAVHKTSNTSVDARMAANVPPAGFDNPARIQAGGRLYSENCAVCHGAPGLTPTAISKGLNPVPPDLFKASRHPDPKENFQFIKHGVKMTAMPGFGPSLSDDDIWSLVAFLGTAPGLTAAEYTATTTASPGG